MEIDVQERIVNIERILILQKSKVQTLEFTLFSSYDYPVINNNEKSACDILYHPITKS